MRVPFAIPELGRDEIREVVQVIRSGWLTTASRCARFEEEFARFVGSRYALAVSSATAALHLGLDALSVNIGDAVLVPTMTFTATAEVVRYLGADPVFADCDRETFCVTRSSLSDAMERLGAAGQRRAVKAVVPVHFGGHPCEMGGILDLASHLGWKVMEDAAHALPTRCMVSEESGVRSEEGQGQETEVTGQSVQSSGLKAQSSKCGNDRLYRKLVGTVGDVTCFSFYANKTITTGEGGMLCTDDAGIARRVKVMRLHGINRDVWDRFRTGASWEYDVVAPGFKYNMPDLAAALGIHQLRKATLFREKRQKIAERYYQKLEDIPGLILPRLHCAMEDHSWYLFTILIDPEKTANGIDRNRFITELARRDIGTSVHYKPLHRMTYYRDRYGLRPEMFPNAEWVFHRCVSLPMFSSMTEQQLEYVIDAVRTVLRR